MAPRTAQEQEMEQETNAPARAEQFQKALRAIYDLDTRRVTLREKHIQPLTDQISKIKKQLREDLNVPAALFQVPYKAYQVFRKAQEAGDDATIDTLRELFKNLEVGEQGLLFPPSE